MDGWTWRYLPTGLRDVPQRGQRAYLLGFQHEIGLLPEAHVLLNQQDADRGTRIANALAREMLNGQRAGIVCLLCGTPIEDIIQASDIGLWPMMCAPACRQASREYAGGLRRATVKERTVIYNVLGSFSSSRRGVG